MSVDALLRHDRPQDRGAHRRVHRGRRAAGHRRRRGHRPLSRLRLVARARLPAQRRPARASGAPRTATGKAASDVAHRKKTLPVIYAAEHAGPEDRARLLELYATPGPRRATRSPSIVAILERTGAREYTRDQARRYRDEALRELDAAGVVRPDGARPPRGDHRLGHRRLTGRRVTSRQGHPEPADGEPERVAPPVAVGLGHHRAAGHELVVLRVVGMRRRPGRDARRRRRPRRRPTRRRRRPRRPRPRRPGLHAQRGEPVRPVDHLVAGHPERAQPGRRRFADPQAVAEHDQPARTGRARPARRRSPTGCPSYTPVAPMATVMATPRSAMSAAGASVSMSDSRRATSPPAASAAARPSARNHGLRSKPSAVAAGQRASRRDEQVGLAAADLEDVVARLQRRSARRGRPAARRRSGRGSVRVRRGRWSRTGGHRRRPARARVMPALGGRGARGRAARRPVTMTRTPASDAERAAPATIPMDASGVPSTWPMATAGTRVGPGVANGRPSRAARSASRSRQRRRAVVVAAHQRAVRQQPPGHGRWVRHPSNAGTSRARTRWVVMRTSRTSPQALMTGAAIVTVVGRVDVLGQLAAERLAHDQGVALRDVAGHRALGDGDQEDLSASVDDALERARAPRSQARTAEAGGPGARDPASPIARTRAAGAGAASGAAISGPPRRPRRGRRRRPAGCARRGPCRPAGRRSISTVRVRPSTDTWSPGLGTPPMRW